jgi:hypothetical protein
MPELPEVETVKRGLDPLLRGRSIDDADIIDGRLTAPEDPVVVSAELIGERFTAVARRGKYLLFGLDAGRTLVVHLRMSGQLLKAVAKDPSSGRPAISIDATVCPSYDGSTSLTCGAVAGVCCRTGVLAESWARRQTPANKVAAKTKRMKLIFPNCMASGYIHVPPEPRGSWLLLNRHGGRR